MVTLLRTLRYLLPNNILKIFFHRDETGKSLNFLLPTEHRKSRNEGLEQKAALKHFSSKKPKTHREIFWSWWPALSSAGFPLACPSHRSATFPRKGPRAACQVKKPTSQWGPVAMSQFPGDPELSNAWEPALQAGFSECSEHSAYRLVTLYTNYTGVHGTEEMQTTLGVSQGVRGDNSHRISRHSPAGEGTTERSSIPTLLPIHKMFLHTLDPHTNPGKVSGNFCTILWVWIISAKWVAQGSIMQGPCTTLGGRHSHMLCRAQPQQPITMTLWWPHMLLTPEATSVPAEPSSTGFPLPWEGTWGLAQGSSLSAEWRENSLSLLIAFG